MVRDGDDTPEIFLVRRHVKSSYGGAYVFPGGTVDPPDELIDPSCLDISVGDANRVLQLRDGGLCYYVAAIRELFEESGVLLAEHSIPGDELGDIRKQLNAGTLPWGQIVDQRRLRLGCRKLQYFSHWITPDIYPKRYTTRFFLAKMPSDQYACHDDLELTSAMWTTAANALGAAADGKLPLHFPTIKTIEQIAEFDSVTAILDWAGNCERDGVTAIHPVISPGSATPEPRIRRTTDDI